MEAYSNSIEDRLIDGLSFKLEPGASYINDRRSVTFHPSGSNIYNPKSGTKFIRIALTGKDWLDPNTFRVAFDVVNLAVETTTGTVTKPYLRPLSGPWCMFRRVRLLAGSQVIEDIDQYARVHQMMDILTATDSRRNEVVEGFGFLYDDHAIEAKKLEYTGIAPQDYMTVMFKPLCGLLNQSKYIPLDYCGNLVLELELVDDPAEAVASNIAPFTNVNNSLLWELRNVQVKCDMVSLDNSVQESYHQVLMTSKEIPIHYQTLTSQFQTVGPDPFINVSRAATRLKSIFVTLDKNFAGTRLTAGRKAWNDFFSPGSDRNRTGIVFNPSSEDEFELAVQIGSKTFPDGNPIRSHAESYYSLRKTLGVQSSKVHSFDISPQDYRDNKLIMAIDCEKSLGASFTGLNTRSGDLMTVKFKYKNITDAGRIADRMHIVLHTDNIMQIHLTGVTIYD